MNNRSSWGWETDEEDDLNKNVLPESVHYVPKRVILLLDIDCFEVQVWMEKKHLFDSDKPMVVTNPDGKILSVNYTAKSMGVKRGEGRQGQWLEDARQLCLRAGAELVEITPGQRYGKPDTFTPIIESNRILDAIFSWAKLRETKIRIKIERTLRDDFYMDLTELIAEKINSLSRNNPGHGNSIGIPSHEEINVLNRPKEHPCHAYNGAPTTCIEGPTRNIFGEELRSRVQEQELYEHHTDELRLVHGALFADSIIQHVGKKTGYKLSAGLGHSKLVAKLACGLNKPTPSGISIIPDAALPRLSKTIRFQDLPGFGGRTGDALQRWLSSKLGANATHIADIHIASLYGNNLTEVFQELGFSDYEKKASEVMHKNTP